MQVIIKSGGLANNLILILVFKEKINILLIQEP